MQIKDAERFKSRQTWVGRSLVNYFAQNPKAAGAKTLTEARRLAFGHKMKSFACKCGQMKCARDGGKSSHC